MNIIFIDGQILLDKSQAARQGMSGLLRGEPLEAAVPDAIVLAEITVNCLQAVVGLASHNVRLLAFGVSLPANNAFMSQSRSHVVEGRTSRDERPGDALMFGQYSGDSAVIAVE